jgi:hypothetical protein
MMYDATGLVLLNEDAVVIAIGPAGYEGAVGPERQHRGVQGGAGEAEGLSAPPRVFRIVGCRVVGRSSGRFGASRAVGSTAP